MTTITIPKETIFNKPLIAVPQDTYREFLNWQKIVKSMKTFTPTKAQTNSLLKARKNFKSGNYLTFKQLKDELGFNN